MRNTQPPTRTNRWWDWTTAILLYFTLSSAAGRLTATQWLDHLDLVHLLILLALPLGCALGYSQFHRRTVWGLALVYGVILVPWQVGRTLLPMLPWTTRLPLLSERAQIVLAQLFEGRAVEDPIFFLMLMAVLFFGLAVNAGYQFTRHGDPWRSALPPLLAALVIEAYDPYLRSRSLLLALTAFFFLLTLTRLSMLQRQRQWKASHTHLPPFFGLDILRLAAGAALITVILAWSAPQIASALEPASRTWQRLSAPFQRLQEDLANALAAAGQSVSVIRDYYSDELPLGRGNLLSDAPVLLVQADRAPAPGERFYWRARTFDTYSDGRWINTLGDETLIITPERPDLPSPPSDVRRVATFLITPQQPLITLYAPEQPIAIGHAGIAHLTRYPDGSADVTFLEAAYPLHVGNAYQATSALTAATEADLHAAGTHYPDWITAHYLQLPATITDRTRALAEQITAGLETPYDKAKAITAYLRREIRYRNTVPAPPSDQDPVDWLLFDLKAGFCNYYATAEVVLLRSLGIPARIAVGYAQGEPQNADRTTYLVRQRDAHTWPEVYFPGIGWVEFEPTVSQAPLVRPSGETATPAAANAPDKPPQTAPTPTSNRDERLPAEAGDLPAGATPHRTFLQRALPWALMLLALLFALSGVYLHQRTSKKLLPPLTIWLEHQATRHHLPLPAFVQRRAQLARSGATGRAYHEINQALRRLGQPPTDHHTPAERAERLIALLPEAASAIQRVVDAYQAQAYARPTAASSADILQAGRQVRWYAIQKRLQRWLARFQEPKTRS